MKNTKVRKITVIAMLSAAAFLLQLLGSMLHLKVGGFLEIEISDLPAIIGTMALGPVSGVIIELVKNILKCSATTTGFVGEFANFVINGTFVLVAGLIYNRKRTKKGALIALLAATVVMTVAGILVNLYIMLPLYMASAPFEAKLSIVLSTVTPFNLAKGVALSLITALIYKKLSPIIKGN